MLEKGATNASPWAKMPTIRGLRVLAPPDPFRLLACLAGLPGRFALLTAVPPDPGLPWRSWLGACPVAFCSDLVPPDPEALHGGGWSDAPAWLGLLPYEATRSSLERPGWAPQETRPSPHHVHPCWARYSAVLAVDHGTGEVHAVGDDPVACLQLKVLAEREPGVVAEPRLRRGVMEDPGRHRERVEAALELIRAGDIYQVNLARQLRLGVEGDGLGVFRRMVRSSPSPWAALLELPGEPAVYSTSPELFLRTRGGLVETLPIKGTRRRGGWAAQDEALRRALDEDEKERAELAMVVDLERNDLGKLARTGSVRVPRGPEVTTYRTLHHRVARVSARLLPGVSRRELVEAMLPSGSVTGAPKVRAMEVIAGLETARRGLYTGALGYQGHDGELQLAMAIRMLTVEEGEGHYHTGGGIVADSDPEREVEETELKALQVAALLGVPPGGKLAPGGKGA